MVGYQVVGDGPIDLVFASGLGNHIDLAWDLAPAAALTRPLASISRYIVFDRRGAAVSDPISRDADALVGLVEQTWGTSDMARMAWPSRADDEEFIRLGARMVRASASPRSAAAQADYYTRHMDVRAALPLIQAPPW